jgi:eukaryotic-like serine/threonine-protein kinase
VRRGKRSAYTSLPTTLSPPPWCRGAADRRVARRAPASRGGPPRSERAPASRSFPVGDWDRYEPVQFLGAGGMGRVFKARDPKLQRFVALKFLRENEPEHVRRLLREAQAQASIDHPNICKVYEVGEVDGQFYIAMQYIKGKALRAAKEEMSFEAKVEVIRKVAEAMHAAHRLGVTHRDIKPANIMRG